MNKTGDDLRDLAGRVEDLSIKIFGMKDGKAFSTRLELIDELRKAYSSYLKTALRCNASSNERTRVTEIYQQALFYYG